MDVAQSTSTGSENLYGSVETIIGLATVGVTIFVVVGLVIVLFVQSLRD